MTQEQKIEIPLSKSKIIKGLIVSAVFVLIALWLLIYQPTISNPFFNNTLIKYGAAVASFLFFGFGIFYFSKKLTDKKPGFIIDEKGILDNSSAVSAGLIPWADIKELSKVKVMKQEFLIIGVNNPEYYINRQTSFLKKKGMEYNYNNYSSPFAVSANGLKCDLNELITLLDKKLYDYKNKFQQH